MGSAGVTSQPWYSQQSHIAQLACSSYACSSYRNTGSSTLARNRQANSKTTTRTVGKVRRDAFGFGPWKSPRDKTRHENQGPPISEIFKLVQLEKGFYLMILRTVKTSCLEHYPDTKRLDNSYNTG